MNSDLPQPPFRVRTIYSWSGSEDDDLGFIEGDIIEVDNLGDGNWWHGRLKRNKMTGVFPSNYVEMIKCDLPNFSASVRNGFNNNSSESIEDNSSPAEDMQFSFQSSRSFYTEATKNDSYAPQSPYSNKSQSRKSQNLHYSHLQNQLPHSQSVPNHLDEKTRSYRSSYRPSNLNQRSTENFNAPAPPQHSVPVKSKSSYNLSSQNSYSNERSVNRQPRDYDDGYSTDSSNVFSYSNGSYFHDSQSSHASSFAMSDFSATSAGSYARHRIIDQEKEQQLALQTSASGNNLLVDSKKVKMNASTGILKKFFSTKDAPPLPTNLTSKFQDMTVEEKQMNSWIEFKADLNRANSLSSKEKALREKRVRETEGYIIFEPHKQLSTINNNEVLQTENKLDLTSINLSHVDRYIRNLQNSSKVMSPESFITNELGMKYSSKLEYLRALFVLCAELFEIVDPNLFANESEELNINRMFKTKRTTSKGLSFLFHYLCKMMGLRTEMIVGSLKTPTSIVRHHWVSVLINGEWRFVDVGLGNLTHPIYKEIISSSSNSSEPSESFYFLTEPLNIIYTHIPDKYEFQHIVPPIDSMVALALPPCFPSFFKNGLELYKFNNALTRLNDNEIFEIDLKIPKDIEVNSLVLTKNSVNNTLSQVYWKHNERYVKIKGHLSSQASTGFMNIYSGPKGLQKSLQNIHSLSLVIPIVHKGSYRPLDFVIRYPTVPAQSNDIYIKQPQNKNLSYGADYVFSVLQHPSNGLMRTKEEIVKPKIALQSPSGRITKFCKKDMSTPFGVWELPVKCNEAGNWRGLVSVDSGSSLCVFAEWICA